MQKPDNTVSEYLNETGEGLNFEKTFEVNFLEKELFGFVKKVLPVTKNSERSLFFNGET